MDRRFAARRTRLAAVPAAADTSQGTPVALVIGLAVLINLCAAALAGTLMPLILDKFGRDPAVASPVLVTWITDTVGFLSFLGLAALILF